MLLFKTVDKTPNFNLLVLDRWSSGHTGMAESRRLPCEDLLEVFNGFARLDFGRGQDAEEHQAGKSRLTLTATERGSSAERRYAHACHVDVYLEEAMSLLLETQQQDVVSQSHLPMARSNMSSAGKPGKPGKGGKDRARAIDAGTKVDVAGPSPSEEDPVLFLANFLDDVGSGAHMAMRPRFRFVAATDWNRRCFAVHLCESMAHMSSQHVLSMQSFLQLVRLRCPDFSEDLVRLCWSIHTKGRPEASAEFSAGPALPLATALRTTAVFLAYCDFFQAIIDDFTESTDQGAEAGSESREAVEEVENANVWETEIALAALVDRAISLTKEVDAHPPRHMVRKVWLREGAHATTTLGQVFRALPLFDDLV